MGLEEVVSWLIMTEKGKRKMERNGGKERKRDETDDRTGVREERGSRERGMQGKIG